MKRQIIYFVTAILLSSCLAEQNNPLVGPNCHDGIMNQNEEGIDCGGKCIACEEIPAPVEVPCESSLVNNQLVYNGITLNWTSDDSWTSLENDRYQVFVYKNGILITIEIYALEIPSKTTLFPITPWYDVIEGYASIQFNSYDALAGEVYVSKENNQLTVEFCSVDMYNSGSSFELTGRVIVAE